MLRGGDGGDGGDVVAWWRGGVVAWWRGDVVTVFRYRQFILATARGVR